jgi:putative intracellular protease/amidase/DNA-directed RNA polymerase subunit RPC12/RpoP
MTSNIGRHFVLTVLIAATSLLATGPRVGRAHADVDGGQSAETAQRTPRIENASPQSPLGSGQRGAGASQGKKVYVCPPCGLDCDERTFDKPGVCPQCGMTLIEKTEGMKQAAEKPVTVAILLFNGVEIIDYSGPWEVFGAAGFVVHTVAAGTGPIKTVFGQKVIPDYTLENCPPADIVLIPGGGISVAINDSRVISWIQARAKESRYVVSVCNGAFLVAKAGLLDGLSATTTRGLIGQLAKSAPKTKVVRDQRYVDNGKVITTAGLSAGIDGALHVVSKILGKEAAHAVAFGLEYKWDAESN